MPVSPMVNARFYVGLDVGKVKDPAALCVLERRKVFLPGPHHAADPEFGAESLSYRIRHLERCRLGMPYPEVVDRVAVVAAKRMWFKFCTTLVQILGWRWCKFWTGF